MSNQGSNNRQWQPWQPDDFLKPAVTVEEQATSLMDEPEPKEPSASSLTEQHQSILEANKVQAQKQGFAEGYTEGQQQGYQDGLQQSEQKYAVRCSELAEEHSQQRQITAELHHLLNQLQAAVQQIEEQIPQKLLQLALTATKQMVGSLSVPLEATLLVQIEQLLQQNEWLNKRIQLWVSPQDSSMLQRYLPELTEKYQWSIMVDQQMMPGGWRLVSDEQEIDATLETRWQALYALCRQE